MRAAFLSLLALAAPAAAKDAMVSVTWLGHAAFEIVSPAGKRLLIDPYLKGDPATPEAFKDPRRYKPDAILVTHSHFDHSSDALEIATLSGAPVIGVFEWVKTLGLPEKQSWGGNVGGSFTVGDVTVHLVPAIHSSEPAGRPLGFVLSFNDGRSLYHTGDTWIFGDMELINELYHPKILLFNVGGGPYGQDPKTAALAVKKYFKPDAIVPMHFGTFPALSKEEDVREAFKRDKRLQIMRPGETRSF
ncbi:MAG: metal-dependent hydrolase [Elusimicrobia bacterium]|nr:metal-dependent hydrolase [Elusimicrobiota bacterium]